MKRNPLAALKRLLIIVHKLQLQELLLDSNPIRPKSPILSPENKPVTNIAPSDHTELLGVYYANF
jgi:hypothetical protein